MKSQSPDRARLAGIWCDILSYADRRESLFGTLTDRLLDRHPEDRIPHPGFVGSQYTTGGLLFLGMNPGAGGDGRTRDELPHYERLRQLQTAAPQDRVRAFERLMEYDAGWYPAIRIMRTIVTPIVNGAGLTYESIAYLNVLKWRTAKSSGLTQLYRISLKAHTLAQLAELDPGTIAVLGVGVTDCLAALPGFQEKYGQRCITVPRMRGDYSLPPEGIAAVNRIVAKLRSESQPK